MLTRWRGVVWGEDRSLIDRRFAMAEALSHLEHLRRNGRVERSQPDGVAYWSAKSYGGRRAAAAVRTAATVGG